MGEYREEEQVFNQKFDSLIKLIEESKKIAIFTGAGISTLSNIPDFRGKHGIYNNTKVDIESLLYIDFFYSHPDIFYSWARDSWYELDNYKPNIVHKTIALLEERGYLKDGVFTQNIDFLHERAGSKRVYNLHGSLKHHFCSSCNSFYTFDQIKPIVKDGKVPKCKHCGGLIKPDIVFYGEGLDSSTLKKANIVFSQADLTLILGSSLTVYPAAALPALTKYSGGKIVIINANETSQDSDAALIFRDLEQVFTKLYQYLEKQNKSSRN